MTETSARGQLLFRPFEERDFEPLARLMAQTWLTEFPEKAALVASEVELAEYLGVSTWSCVCERDGSVLGAILLAEKGEKRLDGGAWADRGRALEAEAAAYPEVARVIEVEMGGVREEGLLAAEYVARGDAEADNVAKLLIVSPEARGLGLGRRLLDALRERLRGRGAAGYFLMTDDSCDVSFYDHLGLTQEMRRRSEAEWPEESKPVGTADFSLYVYAERL